MRVLLIVVIVVVVHGVTSAVDSRSKRFLLNGACHRSTCQHGGKCDGRPKRPYYHCTCVNGYHGQHCEIDACASHPCQNGGHCNHVPDAPHFKCSCVNGYHGLWCQLDACASHPCQNGGHCNHVPDAPHFKCSCVNGYHGLWCQLDACASHPCQNGGHCNHVPDAPHFKCSCVNGYHGLWCQHNPPVTTDTPATTVQLTTATSTESTTSLPEFNSCNKLSTVTQIADQIVVSTDDSHTCPSGSKTAPEAFVFMHCDVTTQIHSWTRGANVAAQCDHIPLYTPVAAFSGDGQFDVMNSWSGIFVGCLTGGFRLAFQQCDTPANFTHVITGGTGNHDPTLYYTIQYLEPSTAAEVAI